MTNRVFTRTSKVLLDNFSEQRPLRAGSLIITLFGDVLAPRGGTVWLGSLIRALEPFGLNQRLVRTSVFRLAKDGWLDSQPLGRKSYYGLTDTGRRRFETAAKRIYSPLVEDWDGKWMLLVVNGLSGDKRDKLRKELGWLGFGALSSGLLGHPDPDTQAVVDLLREHKVEDTIVVMRAERFATTTSNTIQSWVRRSWQLDDLETRYAGFLDKFRPAFQATRSAQQINSEMAFRVRVLLIHEYRKIHLRDPLLPRTLLPSNWAGQRAYQLCRNLYASVLDRAEEYIDQYFETADGPLPNLSAYFFDRFGGLSNN